MYEIYPYLPPQVWPVGQQVTIQLGMSADSTPAPTSWAQLGLPTGLDIDNDGLISGSTMVPGIYDVTVWANSTGNNTDQLAFHIGISDGGLGVVPAGAVELDVDVRSGSPSVPGVNAGSSGALLHAKRGDTIQFAVGFVKDSVLQELDMVTLVTGIKRDETGPTISESDGVFYRVGEGSGSRYVTHLSFPSDEVDLTLGEEEDENGTEAIYLIEVEASWNWWPPGTDPLDEGAESVIVKRTTQTFKILLQRDWVPAA